MAYKDLQLNQEGEKFYFGAVLSNSVDDMLVIPFFEIARESFLEYDLTKSIYNLANTEKPVIGLISGLPFSGGISNKLIIHLMKSILPISKYFRIL